MLKYFRAQRRSPLPLASPINRNCPHGLREFATPNSFFQCDVCEQHMGVWKTMWGCRDCNYDECEQCYLRSTKQVTSKFGENDETDQKAANKSKTSWTCKACTFVNEGNPTECECCCTKREMSTQDLTKPNLTCSICCDAQCEVAFVECGHCVACERCANSLFAAHYRCCPICRKPIKSRPLRIYFA